MSIVTNLIAFGKRNCLDNALADIRVGLGYTCVELSDKAAGVAWTPGRNPASSCTHLRQAGFLHELKEEEALALLDDDNHLGRAVGLATFNAINSRIERQTNDVEAISRLDIRETDHVVMVGHFAPVVSRIKKTGCRLDIIDLNPGKLSTIDQVSVPEMLGQCDVAVITATSIINNTVDELLDSLQRSRAAILLGPSTPLCPEAFQESRITQLSGSRVGDTENVKKIVSQGGGTMLMKKHLSFVNVNV